MLKDRLLCDPERDLLLLWEAFEKGTFGIIPGPMAPHFDMAKKKPDCFMTHPPVLAVSIGGSNTKLMIAEREKGILKVRYIRAFKNPDTPTPMQEYFDSILFHDKEIMDYLKKSAEPIVGFSIPVPMLKEGVFFHISKVAGITGLIARDLERDAPTHHFGKNIKEYFNNKGIKNLICFYYSDTVVAHQGGISMCHMGEKDRSILLVSGTGLATGDEGNFVITGQAPILDWDEDLFPKKATEGYQYQFVGAGKGLFNLMDRAIKIRQTEPDSQLTNVDLSKYFVNTHDSQIVGEIWGVALGESEIKGRMREIYNEVGENGFKELEWIASRIMEWAVSCIANSAVSTFVYMGLPESGRGHIVFFEGSVIKNPLVFPRLKAEILRLIKEEELYKKIKKPTPRQPIFDPVMYEVEATGNLNRMDLDKVDLTIIGAATSAMAEHCLR